MYRLNELIDIRDGIKECNGFTKVEIYRFKKIFIHIYVCVFKCFLLLTCIFIILHCLYYFV